MPNDTQDRLLKEISNWSTADVVALLKKNKLSECCSAIEEREVDGEALLRLSEGRLNLWKRDLPRTLRWDLCRFVEDLNENPKRYCTEEICGRTSPSPDQSDVPSDSDLWDTDFEEDDEPSRSAGEDSSHNEDYNESSEMYGNSNTRPQNRASPVIPGNRIPIEVEDDNDNIYENGLERIKPSVPPVKPMTSNGNSMVEKLKEQLLQLEMDKKQTPVSKPQLMEKKPGLTKNLENKQALRYPQRSLRPIRSCNKIVPNPESIKSTNMAQPKRILCPPKPKNTPSITPALHEKLEKFKELQNLPKPPSALPKMQNTNLPNATDSRSERTDDSDEYDYEPINAQKNGKQYNSSESLRSVHSTHSMVNGKSKNAHHSPTDNSGDDNQDVYESIPENYDTRSQYVKPKFNRPHYDTEPRSSPTQRMQERPVDLTIKSATVPYSKSSRPLPPTPIVETKPDEVPDRNFDVSSYTEQPWFHNTGREGATALIKGGTSKCSSSPSDGYFLLRPSSTYVNQPWTLALWYKNKVYNIGVRKRPDSKYALGSIKPKEQAFESIEEMISFYTENDLVLNSSDGDVAVGSTRLTGTPPK